MDGADEVQWVPLADHYCTVATVEGMRDFFAKAFTARGYAPLTANGDTWRTHCDVYVAFIKEGLSLSGPEAETHRRLCDDCFREDLRLMRDLHLERLKGRPLPAGTRRFRNHSG